MMHSLDAFGVCRQLKNKTITLDIPVIFMTELDTLSMLNGLSLNILKCSIIVFGDMQKLAIKYLLTSPVSITLIIKLQHNSDDLPVH